jgi:hypothetical protein
MDALVEIVGGGSPFRMQEQIRTYLAGGVNEGGHSFRMHLVLLPRGRCRDQGVNIDR